MQNYPYPIDFSDELLRHLKGVYFVIFDFDGVFTDNTVIVDQNGVEAVSCWRGDGLGLRLLDKAGVGYMVLSTETNPVVSARCKKLAIACFQGCSDKAVKLVEILKEKKLESGRVAYVGNDINDAGCLQVVGVPILVADAHPSVDGLGIYRTSCAGGRGAVREICDLISMIQLAESKEKP